MDSRKSIDEDAEQLKQVFQESYFQNGIKDFKLQQPYLKKLAGLYEQRFNLDRKWQDALKAVALYNSAAAAIQRSQSDEWFELAWNVVDNFLDGRKREEYTLTEFRKDIQRLMKKLTDIRKTLRSKIFDFENRLESGQEHTEDHYEELEKIILNSNNLMKSFANSVIEMATEVMKQPAPCDFAAVGIGSLGRGEATPFSDVEYLFLIKDPEQKPYFERLAVMTYFLIGALRETKLSSMDIDELNGWFVDGRKKGYQIDGITGSSSNIPTYKQSRPNLFIATPSELLEAYKDTLHNPSEDANKGDMTAMLRFTTEIISNEEGGSLLSEFENGRDQLQIDLPLARVKANIRMLETDTSKHEFSPEFDDYLAGFSMAAKSLLYRLPSLISADLAVILDNKSFHSSFDSIKSWQGHDFGDSLKTLLVCACYARLRCYLFSDSCDDQFELGSSENPQSSEQLSFVAKSQQQLVFEKRNVWNISETEFHTLCERLLVLQRCAKPLTKSIDTANVQELIGKISPQPEVLERVLSNFYSLRWSRTLETVEEMAVNHEPQLSHPKVIYARARTHLQRREFAKAISFFEQMREMDGDNLPFIDVYRGLAQCYEGVGLLEKAEEVYLEASKIRCSAKEKSLLKFEHARLELKLNEDNVDIDHIELFESLNFLRVHTATLEKCDKTELLHAARPFKGVYNVTWFESLLPLLCNPTRALAHCLHVMGKIFAASKNKEMADKYLKRAQCLGLQTVIDLDADYLAKATMLRDIGRDYGCLDYLIRAQDYIETLQVKGEFAKQIECDIALSAGICHTQLTASYDTESAEHQLILEGLDTSSRKATTEKWFADCEEKIQQVFPDSSHYYYGKLHQINADLLGSKGSDSGRLHDSYAKACEIFEKHECKLDAAYAYKADAKAYHEEGNWAKFADCLGRAKKLMQEVFPKSHKKRRDFQKILSDEAKWKAEEEERKKKEEEDRRKAEEEERKKKEEEDRRKAEEEERKKKEEEDRRKAEEERKKKEEEDRRKAEEERKQKEEARRKAEEERKQKEEARRKEEEERKQKEEDRRKAEEEERARPRKPPPDDDDGGSVLAAAAAGATLGSVGGAPGAALGAVAGGMSVAAKKAGVDKVAGVSVTGAAAAGAAMGAVAGPIGAGVGAVVGGLGGIIGTILARKN